MKKTYYIIILILMISCDLRNPNYSDEEIIKMKHDIIENGDDESYNEIYSNIGRKDSLLNIEMLPYSLKMMDVKNSESEYSFFKFFLRAKFKGKYNPNDLIKLAKPEQDLLIYYLEKRTKNDSNYCAGIISEYYRNGIYYKKNVKKADSIYESIYNGRTYPSKELRKL